jgi:hypothetical protein
MVARCSGSELLRNARYNKGLAFTEEERRVHFLTGLLPPAVETQELQVMCDPCLNLQFKFRARVVASIIRLSLLLLSVVPEWCLQVKRIMRNIRKLQEPLDKYTAIMDLQVLSVPNFIETKQTWGGLKKGH